MSEIDLDVVKIKNLEQGDIVVIRTDTILSEEMADNIKKQMSCIIPDGVKVLILTDGMEIDIVKPQVSQMNIHKPTKSGSHWVVRICESKSPLSPVLETMKFSSRETAYQAYRQVMKDLGRGT